MRHGGRGFAEQGVGGGAQGVGPECRRGAPGGWEVCHLGGIFGGDVGHGGGPHPTVLLVGRYCGLRRGLGAGGAFLRLLDAGEDGGFVETVIRFAGGGFGQGAFVAFSLAV